MQLNARLRHKRPRANPSYREGGPGWGVVNERAIETATASRQTCSHDPSLTLTRKRIPFADPIRIVFPGLKCHCLLAVSSASWPLISRQDEGGPAPYRAAAAGHNYSSSSSRGYSGNFDFYSVFFPPLTRS